MTHQKYDSHEKMAWKNNYWHPLLLALILIGALNWGFVVLNYNPVEMLSTTINTNFGGNLYIDKIIYIIIVFAAIRFAMRYENWYPIYERTKFPSILVPLRNPERSDMIVTIKTKPNSKIAYWTTLPSSSPLYSHEAYGDYSNSGVVMSNDEGIAKLAILEGSNYIQSDGTPQSRHIKYRLVGLPYGIAGPVQEVKY
jgi:uncharacterized membrane protein YuzA (DUF378 family)